MASINALRPALAAPQRIGLAFSVFSSLSYGSSPGFVRFAYYASVGSLAWPLGVCYFGDTPRGAEPVLVTLPAAATAALIFVPLAALKGSLGLPATTLGLVGVVGVSVTYLSGVLTFFAALIRIGPMKAALLAQLEPVVSILCAVLILEEQLSLVQGLRVAVGL